MFAAWNSPSSQLRGTCKRLLELLWAKDSSALQIFSDISQFVNTGMDVSVVINPQLAGAQV